MANLNKEELAKIQKSYDEMFVGIFSGLTESLLYTVQSATQQILDLSSGFLDTNVSDALEDFHNLYQNNIELETSKESIEKNVDEIIDFVQKQKDVDKESEEQILSKIDDEQLSASRLSLSHLQSDMEALVVLDEELKKQVMPILHNMQFEDQLSANLSIITDAWQYFIETIHADEHCDCAEIAAAIYQKLNSVKLRALFCECVMGFENVDDKRLTDEVYANFVNSLAEESQTQDFLSRMEKFCTQVFNWGNEDSEASTTLIMEIISAVQRKAMEFGDYSDSVKEAFSNLSDIAMGFNNPHKRESTKILMSLMKNRMDAHGNIKELVEPIMMSMQFQDRIRQNMENLSKFMMIWLATREEVLRGERSLDDDACADVGNQLLDKMTMNSEREVIEQMIPQVAGRAQDGGDGAELF